MDSPAPLPAPPAAGLDPERDEARLVEAARREPQAFAALYRSHQPTIARYVRRRVGDGHAADDLVAETFATALARLGAYRQRGLPFRAWLYRIASNAIRVWVRRARGRNPEPLPEDAAAPRAEPAPGRDEIERARAALLALPERYQTTLSLHYLEELSVDEVAAVLGCRPGTVKARLARGRVRLRARLAARAPSSDVEATR